VDGAAVAASAARRAADATADIARDRPRRGAAFESKIREQVQKAADDAKRAEIAAFAKKSARDGDAALVERARTEADCAERAHSRLEAGESPATQLCDEAAKHARNVVDLQSKLASNDPKLTVGMALREECEAFARRCEQERKDCEKHVSAFHDTDKKTGGQSKMHAINTSASCLTRAQNMTKEAKKLQDAAVQRVLDLKKSGASADKVKRADATAVVVRDAASAAAFETSTANKAFRTTSALNRK